MASCTCLKNLNSEFSSEGHFLKDLAKAKAEIEAKEKVFKDADKVVTQSNHTLNPESLCKLLNEIETCMTFFQDHPTYKDSAKYQVKCKAASSRILTFIKDYFRSSLERNESSEQSFDLFYGRLKMIAPKFYKIMDHLFGKTEDSPLKEDIGNFFTLWKFDKFSFIIFFTFCFRFCSARMCWHFHSIQEKFSHSKFAIYFRGISQKI